MEKWEIDFLEISKFSKKIKKESARKIIKYKRTGGTREAKRPPPRFGCTLFLTGQPLIYNGAGPYKKLKKKFSRKL